MAGLSKCPFAKARMKKVELRVLLILILFSIVGLEVLAPGTPPSVSGVSLLELPTKGIDDVVTTGFIETNEIQFDFTSANLALLENNGIGVNGHVGTRLDLCSRYATSFGYFCGSTLLFSLESS